MKSLCAEVQAPKRTDDEIDALADRELDIAVAESLMGLKFRKYSDDIAAAWQVVEELGQSGWRHFDLERYAALDGSFQWIAIFGKSHRREAASRLHVHAVATTAPFAICRAGLKTQL